MATESSTLRKSRWVHVSDDASYVSGCVGGGVRLLAEEMKKETRAWN